MSGLAGSFFRELSDTMQITMVCSFLVTWLLLPVLHLLIGYRAGKNAHAHNAAQEQADRLRWLTGLFARPLLALLLLGLGVGAWLAAGKLETGFLPDLDEGTIVLDYYLPAGTDEAETDRVLRRIEKDIITKHPEVESYSRRTGIGLAFDTRPPNYGDYLIQLRRDHRLTTPAVIAQLRQRIEATEPALTVDFGQRIADLLGDLMSSSKPIEVKVFGDDQATLEKLSARIGQVLGRVPGVADVNDGLVAAGPSIVFRPDVAKLALYGLTPLDFQAQLGNLVGGQVLSNGTAQASISPAQAGSLGGVQVGQVQDGEQLRQVLLRPLNVSSYTGIIMIVGIIAENAIFTVHQFYDPLRETGDVDTAIRYAIALRIRPKLMTAIGAILALSPLALGIGLGAQMQQPLAVAVIGGFVVALPVLLFVLPTGMRFLYHHTRPPELEGVS